MRVNQKQVVCIISSLGRADFVFLTSLFLHCKLHCVLKKIVIEKYIFIDCEGRSVVRPKSIYIRKYRFLKRYIVGYIVI